MYRTKRMAPVWGMMAMLIIATAACTLFSSPQWSIQPLSLPGETLYTSEQRTWNFDAPPHGAVIDRGAHRMAASRWRLNFKVYFNAGCNAVLLISVMLPLAFSHKHF